MIPAVVLTDLDGTLLEEDGTLAEEAREVLARCAAAGVPVCPVTSKTCAELDDLLALVGSEGAGFENGAGVRHADGHVDLMPAAVPLDELRRVLAALRRATGLALPSLEELDDEALAAITCLPRQRLAAVRRRLATLPVVAPPETDELLRDALPHDPPVRLLRGNRFLHLQGRHGKADVVPLLLHRLHCRPGPVVACGDAPNDIELLAAAHLRIIVPGEAGPHPELCRRFPDARVAPHPHGRGWAAAVGELLAGGES